MENKGDNKIIQGKMIDCIGSEFNVFLMKNMSLFISDSRVVFILPPYDDRKKIQNGFTECNRGKYKDEEQQQLYSFFTKHQDWAFYPYTSNIKYSINDNS